jgi:hypothetical protein
LLVQDFQDCHVHALYYGTGGDMNARFKELVAMILIGDGVLNVLQPQRHTAIWNCGPKFYREGARTLELHPAIARVLGVAFLGLGVVLAQSAARISRSALREKGRIARASEAALNKAKRSVDVEYEQGEGREIPGTRRA